MAKLCHFTSLVKFTITGHSAVDRRCKVQGARNPAGPIGDPTAVGGPRVGAAGPIARVGVELAYPRRNAARCLEKMGRRAQWRPRRRPLERSDLPGLCDHQRERGGIRRGRRAPVPRRPASEPVRHTWETREARTSADMNWMEARGIEPRSEHDADTATTCVGYALEGLATAARRRPQQQQASGSSCVTP
jgi:hypothetical protein